MENLWNDSFVLFTKIGYMVSQLTNEEAGELFRAILSYQMTGQVPEMSRIVAVVFAQAKADMDYCKAQKDEKKEKSSEGGKKSAKVRALKAASERERPNESANAEEGTSTPLNTLQHPSTPFNHNGDGDVYGDVNGDVNDNSNSYINNIHTDEPRPAAGRECVKSGSPSKPPKEDPQKKKKSDVMEKRFERFWSAYPKKVGKGDARKAFLKVNPSDALLGRMVTAVAAASTSYQWQKNKGQFIPNPATWLNQQRWEDEVPPDMGRPDSMAAPQVKTKFSNFAEHEYTDEDEAVELELMRRGVLDGGN